MKVFFRFILILSLFFSSLTMYGWGQIGHRVIGSIADRHLSRKAKKNIKKLLGDESLAIASTWMDEVRSDSAYDHTHDWHWVSIPDGQTYAETEKNPDGDLIEAIERMKALITSDTSTMEERAKALRFLVHLVGDLHQPLHVGNGTDRGGNNVKVKWFYKSSNLHRIWDSEIIDSKQLSYSELACSIDHSSKDQIKKWQSGTTVLWAQEAMQYRTQIYDIDGAENLSYEYMYENWGLVQQQLEKGGVRLAGVINELFD